MAVATDHLPQEEHAVGELAAARRGLRDASVICVLLIPIQFAVLATLQESASDDHGSWRWDVPEVWVPRLAVIFALAAAVLGLLALAVRWLPGGRDAARLEPLARLRGRPPGAPPPGVSWLAVVGVLVLLAVGGLMAEGAFRGWGALAGLGERFTMGTDAEVVQRWRNRRGVVTSVSTPYGRKVLEGGRGNDGEVYASWPVDDGHAWRLGFRGVLTAVGITMASMLAFGLAVFGIRWQWRRRRAAKLWVRTRRGRRTRPRLVLALQATAVVVVLATAGTALAVQVSNYEAKGQVSVPALAAIGAPERLRVIDWLAEAHDDVGLPEPERVRWATLEPGSRLDHRVDVEAVVQRYDDAASAAATERAIVRYWAKRRRYSDTRPVRLPNGERGEADYELARLASTRAVGSTLVVLRVRGRWLDKDATALRAEVENALAPRMPAAVDAITEAAPRILDARLEWWR